MSLINKILSFTGINKAENTDSVDTVSSASPSVHSMYNRATQLAAKRTNENSLTDISSLRSKNQTYDINELESKKSELTSSKVSKEQELASINSGENEQLQNLKSSMDEAYTQYQDALSEDCNTNPELSALKEQENEIKAQSETNAQNILNKESEISSKENEISEQNSVISGFESELETLVSELNSIPNNSNEQGSEQSNAQLDEKRAQINKLIELKKEEINLAKEKLTRLEQEKESLSLELTGLKEEKTNLDQQQTDIQAQISKTASNAVNTAQEKYNQAKETFESTRSSLSSQKQEDISNLQTQIEQVEAQITEARNQQYEKGDYSITGTDVVQLATQYEGLTNDEMHEIFNSENARFDDGAWCADFVTHMMNKTYGENNTPGDFYNQCPMFCAVREIKSWGDENDRTTLDTKDVKAGDAIIVNTSSGGLHIGMVVSFNDDGTINTIEGNTLDDNMNYDDNNPGQVNKRLRTPDEVNTYVKFH